MARHQDEYKEFQDAYEAVEGEWDEDWSNEEKQRYYENLKSYNEEELERREKAREDWGDDADDGHDQRIEKLGDRKQLLNHCIANAEGEYDYQTQGMQDLDDDLRRESEENSSESGSDMEIERESDSESSSDSGSGSRSRSGFGSRYRSTADAHADSYPDSGSDSGSDSNSDMELLSDSE